MSLYDEAAVALIAEGAAGKDGVLYNIKPEEKLKATELVTNGGFDTDSDWTKGANVTISGGTAVFTNVVRYNNLRTNADVFTAGKTYKVSYEVLDFVGSDATAHLEVHEFGQVTEIGSGVFKSGKYSHIYTPATTCELGFKVVAGSDAATVNCKIDNVSVKEVEQAPKDFTFTRGSNLTATRVGPDGLIEKGRENLLKYSNEFDNALWEGHISGSALISTITGGQTGYDGSSNAFLLNKDSSDLFKRREQIVAETAGVATFSVYAKAGTASSITLRGGSDDVANIQNGNDDAANFNLANGTSSNVNNAVTSSMEAITGSAGDTDRWYRCSVVFKDPTQLVQIYINFNSASTGTVFFQNAQLEAGLVATDYIDSNSTTGKAGILEDSPRFDYLDVTCPHLLMEPTRLNYFAHSEYLAGTFGTINSTFTANADKSPEGVNNATSVLESTANAAHGLQKIDIDIEDGVFYSYSFFVKAKGRTKFLVQHSEETTMNTSVTVDLSGTPSVTEGRPAATGSQSIVDYGNGWYRVEINGKEGLADDADSNLNIFFHNGSGTSYTGDTTKGFLFYGFQLEKKHFCTSYIPNHGTSDGVTRNEDDTNSIDLSDYMDGEDVTLFVDLADNPLLIRDGSTSGIKLSNGTSDASSIRFYRSYENAANGGLRTMVYFANNENDGEDINVHQITESGRVKVAVRRVKSTGEFTVFYDGAQKSQDFSSKFENFDTLRIDGRNQPLFINSVIVFDRALTDDECTSLTTV